MDPNYEILLPLADRGEGLWELHPLFEFERIGGRGNVVKHDIDLRKEHVYDIYLFIIMVTK